MVSQRLFLGLTLALFALPGSTLAQEAVTDPEVIEGIAQVEDGEYGTAVLTLDRAARRLSGDPDKTRDLSQAYLYLGIAYFGQGHEAASKANFRDAIRQFGDISLNPELYPPAIINLFEAAREEAGEAVPATATAPAPPQPPGEEKKGGSNKVLLLVGAAVLVGGGVAVAAGGGDSGSTTSAGPSSVTASVSPDGLAIIHFTELTFSATATNLSSPSFSWDFGDGASVLGQSVTHTYGAEGSFTVRVTASGAEGTVSDTLDLSARSVSGVWVKEMPPGSMYGDTLEIEQQGANLVGTWIVLRLEDNAEFHNPLSGTLEPPNRFAIHDHGICQTDYTGTYEAELNQMVGETDFQNDSCGADVYPLTVWRQ